MTDTVLVVGYPKPVGDMTRAWTRIPRVRPYPMRLDSLGLSIERGAEESARTQSDTEKDAGDV